MPSSYASPLLATNGTLACLPLISKKKLWQMDSQDLPIPFVRKLEAKFDGGEHRSTPFCEGICEFLL
jgi:hypothetical protein